MLEEALFNEALDFIKCLLEYFLECLLEQHPRKYCLGTSATARMPRAGEMAADDATLVGERMSDKAVAATRANTEYHGFFLGGLSIANYSTHISNYLIHSLN